LNVAQVYAMIFCGSELKPELIASNYDYQRQVIYEIRRAKVKLTVLNAYSRLFYFKKILMALPAEWLRNNINLRVC